MKLRNGKIVYTENTAGVLIDLSDMKANPETADFVFHPTLQYKLSETQKQLADALARVEALKNSNKLILKEFCEYVGNKMVQNSEIYAEAKKAKEKAAEKNAFNATIENAMRIEIETLKECMRMVQMENLSLTRRIEAMLIQSERR